MRKLLLGWLLATVFSITAYAQQGNIDINAGIDIGLPVGDWSEGYGIGLGATAKGLYGISDAGQVGLTLGYIRFGLKDEFDEGLSGSLGVIPVMAVYRHHFGNLYVEPQAGLSINRVSLSYSGFDDMGFGFSGSASESSFGYAAGIGYLMGNIDLSARYQGFAQGGENGGFGAIRIAYNFGLK